MTHERHKRSGLVLGLLITAMLACLVWQATAAEKEDEGRVPEAVRKAIQKTFPKAKIGNAEASRHVMVIHEVDLVIEGQPCTVEVLANGEILNMERDIPAARLPKAVSEAVKKQAANAKITEIEEKRGHAQISVARLSKPTMIYEIEYTADGREVEVQFTQDGKLLSRKVEDDDDGNETDVSLKDVPAAVRKTILKHAGENRVTEVEKQTRNGKTTYEAEWREGGKEVEITVDADGNLLGREVGDDDEDDDDDDDDDDD